MKYGLPYKGSKNKLAERIVRLLPKRTHLVDLFCGGCAVSHAALLMGKYEHIHINDINWMCPTLFIDALNGKYNNDTRWISREDFFRLKDTDPYVAMVWSFGNNMRTYLYSQEIEPLKKAIHYAIFFSDYSLAKELGHDLSFIEPIEDMRQRYSAVKRYFGKQGHFKQQSFEGGGQNQRIQLQLESFERTSRLGTFGGGVHKECSRQKRQSDSKYQTTELGGSETTHPYQPRKSRECRNTILWSEPHDLLQSKKKNIQATSRSRTPRASQHNIIACNTANASSRCQDLGGQHLPITSSVLDYEKVEIPEDSVIYCDIPYEGTNVYNGAERFNYERFYDWAERQTQPVFISSYQMPPDRFDCIQEYSHHSTLNDRYSQAVTERIFVPKHQTERGNVTRQLTLDLFGE